MDLFGRFRARRLAGDGVMPAMDNQTGGIFDDSHDMRAADIGYSIIGKDAIAKANEVLRQYKQGKANLEARIIEDEKWFKMRHWELFHSQGNPADIQPRSAWLWNVIVGKHADMVEAYPEPIVLPREPDDEGEAKTLSDILPIIMQRNDFEDTYSDAAWTKNKSGTAVYGVFWDASKLNGLGDITIKRIDLLNLFWQPGVDDIQDSRHVFHVEAWDNDRLRETYGKNIDVSSAGAESGVGGVNVAEYVYDDNIPKENKTLVVDWYYKKHVDGKTVVHYAKYAGNNLLYASENDPDMVEGWYTDGEYPFIFDRLFPVEGSIAGYGYIDVGKSTQEQLDLLGQALIKNAVTGATPRIIVNESAGVNEKEYMDNTKSVVHAVGSLNGDTLRPIDSPFFNGNYISMYNNLVEQLKYTTGNMDITNGGTMSGVTAASAIAALQESAGRSSKASIKASYRAYARLVYMVIARIKQFYDAPRMFRVLGLDGAEQYIWYSNQNMQKQILLDELSGEPLTLKQSIFDIEVKAAKQTAYSRLSQNELAVQLYTMGVFSPEAAQPALMMLDMMDFSGKDELVKKLTAQHEAYQQQQMMAAAMMGMPPMPMQGAPMAVGQPPAPVSLQQPENRENARVANARAAAQQASQPE